MLYELFVIPENHRIPDLGTFNVFRDTKTSFSSFATPKVSHDRILRQKSESSGILLDTWPILLGPPGRKVPRKSLLNHIRPLDLAHGAQTHPAAEKLSFGGGVRETSGIKYKLPEIFQDT